MHKCIRLNKEFNVYEMCIYIYGYIYMDIYIYMCVCIYAHDVSASASSHRTLIRAMSVRCCGALECRSLEPLVSAELRRGTFRYHRGISIQVHMGFQRSSLGAHGFYGICGDLTGFHGIYFKGVVDLIYHQT